MYKCKPILHDMGQSVMRRIHFVICFRMIRFILMICTKIMHYSLICKKAQSATFLVQFCIAL